MTNPSPVLAYQALLQQAKSFILQAIGPNLLPKTLLVLGSGLSEVAQTLLIPGFVSLPYSNIPGFAVSTVSGHAGCLLLGKTHQGLPLAIMQGRFHAYEGYRLDEVVFPLRVLAALGVNTLLLTNAAGSLNPACQPGQLLQLADHINLTGDNPLIGPVSTAFGPRFVDMTEPYCPELRETAQNLASQLGFNLPEGVYAALKGPSYETKAEVRMLQALGADAVGMSTVVEAIAARQLGLRVWGCSCLTNLAAGLSPSLLNHHEVTEVGQQASKQLSALLEKLLQTLL